MGESVATSCNICITSKHTAVPFTLGSAADLVDVAIQRIYLKKTDMPEQTFYDKFMDVETGVTDYYLKDSSISGLGTASRIVENAVITAESPIQGYDNCLVVLA